MATKQYEIPHRCTRCDEPLKDEHIVWLELNNRDNRWLRPGVMDLEDPNNQGGFPFGATCAKRALRGQDW